MADNSDKRVHNQSHHPFKEWGSQTRPGRRKTRRHRNRFFLDINQETIFWCIGEGQNITTVGNHFKIFSWLRFLSQCIAMRIISTPIGKIFCHPVKGKQQLLSNRRDPHASGKGIFLTLVISLPDCSVLPPDCPYSLLLVRTVTLDGRQPPQATLEHSLPCLGSPYSTPLCPLEPPSSPSSSILEESVPPWAHPRGRVQNPSTE